MPQGDLDTDLRLGEEPQISENQRARLLQSMEFIQAHCTERINLKDVAAVAELSIYHFHRLFHLHFKKTVKRAITECQVKVAQRLLLDGVETVEAAKRAGFANQSHLTARFKSVSGYTPALWRRLQQRGAAPIERTVPTSSIENRQQQEDVSDIVAQAARLREAADELLRRAQRLSGKSTDPESGTH